MWSREHCVIGAMCPRHILFWVDVISGFARALRVDVGPEMLTIWPSFNLPPVRYSEDWLISTLVAADWEMLGNVKKRKQFQRRKNLQGAKLAGAGRVWQGQNVLRIEAHNGEMACERSVWVAEKRSDNEGQDSLTIAKVWESVAFNRSRHLNCKPGPVQ